MKESLRLRAHPRRKQLGVEYASVASTPKLRTAEGFLQIKQRYASAGIKVWNIGNTDVHNMPEVTLNLPGRDEKIEAHKRRLRKTAYGVAYLKALLQRANEEVKG